MEYFTEFLYEDHPRFETCMVLPYWYDREKKQIQLVMRRDLNDPSRELQVFGGAIQEREPSIFFTIARSMILQSCNYFPFQEAQEILSPRPDIHLYYNPHINQILMKLAYSDQVLFTFDEVNHDSCFKVWYPMEKQIDKVEEVNSELRKHAVELELINLAEEKLGDLSELPEPLANFVESTFENLKSKFQQIPEPKKPELAILIMDDAHDWAYLYEALLMPQLMKNGNQIWKHYLTYKEQLPSDEELKSLKALFMTGSARSVYEKGVPWIDGAREFIIKVFNDFPHVKMVGGCFGEQLLAHTLGGRTEKMLNNPLRPKIIGRELIIPSSEFFDQKWVQKYMQKNNYDRKTFPNIVLQESHGDHVKKLPTGATLLGSSESCQVEMYCIGDRVLAFQSHPEFNCGFQQELSEPEYFQAGLISSEYHTLSWLNCAKIEHGKESRNMVLGLIKEFMNS